MPHSSAQDLYELLDLDPSASPAEVRRSWRRLALRWHPDRVGAPATGMFQKISAAYTVLSNPATRAAYDRLRAPSQEPAAPARRRAPAVMLSRLTGPLESLLACGVARIVEPGVIELFFDEDEAASGGVVTIASPVDVECRACAGRGGACAICGGAGTVKERFSAWLSVPPGVRDGTILTPSVELRGSRTRLRFAVRLPSSR